jgi:ATP adenylyltransferase
MADKAIWAPWRSEFVLGKKEKGCVFCSIHKSRRDKQNGIILRGESNYVVLNKYPYNVGHTLVVPYRHLSSLERLTDEEALEMMQLSRRLVDAMKRSMKPNAFNLGMNLGQAAGAGIPRHLHMHVVPRWTGDNNFLPVIGKTRIHSVPMVLVRKTLLDALSSE